MLHVLFSCYIPCPMRWIFKGKICIIQASRIAVKLKPKCLMMNSVRPNKCSDEGREAWGSLGPTSNNCCVCVIRCFKPLSSISPLVHVKKTFPGFQSFPVVCCPTLPHPTRSFLVDDLSLLLVPNVSNGAKNPTYERKKEAD